MRVQLAQGFQLVAIRKHPWLHEGISRGVVRSGDEVKHGPHGKGEHCVGWLNSRLYNFQHINIASLTVDGADAGSAGDLMKTRLDTDQATGRGGDQYNQRHWFFECRARDERSREYVEGRRDPRQVKQIPSRIGGKN